MIDIRAVIIDWGGVMALPPSKEAFARLQELAGLDAVAFAAAWSRHRRVYDLGEVDAREYWRRVGGEGGRNYDQSKLERLLAQDAACWSVPNAAMVSWLQRLKAVRLRLALLSNTPREQWVALQPTLTWLPLCDIVMLSCELGLAKPDPAFYSLCLECLGLGAGETLCIDDRVENVATADELGINAILFTTADALKQELVERFGERLPLP
jgi:putative hydrolase of the HAD superfamily